MKMLICGVSDVAYYPRLMFYLSICFISFVFLFFVGVFLFVSGFYFVLNDLVYFVEWEVITLNSSRVVMTFLFD
jgi:NADH-ubiquinone oxidoreductase chain 5